MSNVAVTMPKLPWVVLKFGGTSVATAKNWGVICDRVLELLPTNRVWVTISALSQTTNLLLKAIDEAVSGGDHTECYAKIFNRHMHLAVTAGLTSMQASAASGKESEPDTAAEAAAVASTPELQPLVKLLEDLKRILEGVKMTEDASPRIRARICSFGNLACSVSATFGNGQKFGNSCYY